MLRIDLRHLRRSRTLPLSARIDSDDEIWTDSQLTFADAVEVTGSVATTAEGGVLVRGSWRASLLYDCSRCLQQLEVVVKRSLTLVYTPADGWEVADPDVRAIGYQQTMLDLTEAIREEIVLEVPRYLLPSEEDGRCVECGDPVERFKKVTKEPDSDGIDPRWSALQSLKTD